MKRLDFLKSIAAMPWAIRAVLASKPLPTIPGLPKRLIGVSRPKRGLRRMVYDMPWRNDLLLNQETFTTISSEPGDSPGLLQFFGHSPATDHTPIFDLSDDETT